MSNSNLTQEEREELENLLSKSVLGRNGSRVLEEVPSEIIKKLDTAEQLESLSILLDEKVNSLNTEPGIEGEIMIS